jgi:hypothetical protein
LDEPRAWDGAASSAGLGADLVLLAGDRDGENQGSRRGDEEEPMRLTWRDGVDSVLAAVVVVAVVGILEGRRWPLLGTARSSALAMFAVGFLMCQVGMRGTPIAHARDLVRDPFMIAATTAGVVALCVAVLGLLAPARWVAVVLGATLLATWALATAHHALGEPAARAL